MKQITKRTTRAASVAIAVGATLTLVTATPAFAINEVGCGRSDFLKVRMHYHNFHDFDQCFANAGELGLVVNGYPGWVTRIETGNNRVQWLGDGRWQPAKPIGKWTVFRWPNHPGGVRIDAIRIL